MANILSILGGIIKPLFDGIDAISTTKEEKLQLLNVAKQMEHEFAMKMYEYQLKLLTAQENIITSEANSKSWLTRMWRPIVMIMFAFMVFYDWASPIVGLPPAVANPEAMNLIKIGLGGYVVGRSGEKIAKTITEGKVNANQASEYR